MVHQDYQIKRRNLIGNLKEIRLLYLAIIHYQKRFGLSYRITRSAKFQNK